MHISDYGGAPNGSDTAPAWNVALEQMINDPSKELVFDKGVYEFHTSITRLIDDGGIMLRGRGSWNTFLRRNFSQDPAENFIEIQGRGSGVEHLAIVTAPGTTGGRGLYMFCDNSTLPGGKHAIRDVRISGTLVDGVHQGTFNVPFFARGDARTISPIGMRQIFIENLTVFDGQAWLAQFWGCLSCEWFGGGAWQAGGTAKGIAIGGTLPGVTTFKNRIDADIWWTNSSVAAGQMRGHGP